MQDGRRASPPRGPASPPAQSQDESSPQTFGVTLTSRQKAVSEPAAADASSPAGDGASPAAGAAVFGVTLGAKPAPLKSTAAAEDTSAVRICCSNFAFCIRLRCGLCYLIVHATHSPLSQDSAESKKKPAFAAVAKEICAVCQKTVYPMVLPRPLSPLLPPSLNCVLQERLSADDLGVFHKVVLFVSYCIVFSPEANAHAALQTCLKCLECGTVLSLGKFASLGGKVSSPGFCGGTVFHELGLLARSLFTLHCSRASL